MPLLNYVFVQKIKNEEHEVDSELRLYDKGRDICIFRVRRGAADDDIKCVDAVPENEGGLANWETEGILQMLKAAAREHGASGMRRGFVTMEGADNFRRILNRRTSMIKT